LVERGFGWEGRALCRSWINQEIDWPTLPPSHTVILGFAAQAVSHTEAGHETMGL